MQRSFAVSLGALALAIVAFRGALRSDLIIDVVPSGMAAMIVFSAIGWIAGMIADHLVRDAVERNYRQRLSKYREAVETNEGQQDTPAANG
ncbi:MAG: hypothetical protein WD119_02245 [Pirellulaceae bacterium]